jgi:hypothetical protein
MTISLRPRTVTQRGDFVKPNAGTVTAFPQCTEIFVECRSEQRTNGDRVKNTNERSGF